MTDHKKIESAVRRAWRDTTHLFQATEMQVSQAVVTVIIATFVALAMLRRTDDATAQTIATATATLISLFAPFMITLAFSLALAPLRQRNELREALKAERDPVDEAIGRLTEKQMLERFVSWSGRIAAGASLMDTGFDVQGVGYLVKIGLVQPQVQDGVGFTGRVYFLTPLAIAMLSHLEGDGTMCSSAKPIPSANSTEGRGTP